MGVTTDDDFAGELAIVKVIGFDMYFLILQDAYGDMHVTYGDILNSVLSLETYADYFELLSRGAPTASLMISSADGGVFATGELQTGEFALEKSVLPKSTVFK